MEIVWENLKVADFLKICRLCLAKKELLPLAEEENFTLIKFSPWIAQLETSAYFPNKICADCSKQLHQMNEFFNYCNTLAHRFHKCIEIYEERISKDSSLPSLQEMLFPPEVIVKQEVVADYESEQELCTTMPFTEVFVEEIKKEEIMQFEETTYIPPEPKISNSVELSNKANKAEYNKFSHNLTGKIKKPKTSTERSRLCRQRKRGLVSSVRPPPKTGAQRVREFRARHKALDYLESIFTDDSATFQILPDIDPDHLTASSASKDTSTSSQSKITSSIPNISSNVA